MDLSPEPHAWIVERGMPCTGIRCGHCQWVSGLWDLPGHMQDSSGGRYHHERGIGLCPGGGEPYRRAGAPRPAFASGGGVWRSGAGLWRKWYAEGVAWRWRGQGEGCGEVGPWREDVLGYRGVGIVLVLCGGCGVCGALFRTVWRGTPPRRYSITPLEVCSSSIAATTQGATSWRVSSSGTRRRAAKAASCPPTYRIVAAVSGFGDGTGRRRGGRGLGGGGVCRMCDGRGEGVSWRGAGVGEGRSGGLYP